MQIINPIWFQGERETERGSDGWECDCEILFELCPTSHGPLECVSHTTVVWKCQKLTSRTSSEKQEKKKGAVGSGILQNRKRKSASNPLCFLGFFAVKQEV